MLILYQKTELVSQPLDWIIHVYPVHVLFNLQNKSLWIIPQPSTWQMCHQSCLNNISGPEGATSTCTAGHKAWQIYNRAKCQVLLEQNHRRKKSKQVKQHKDSNCSKWASYLTSCLTLPLVVVSSVFCVLHLPLRL